MRGFRKYLPKFLLGVSTYLAGNLILGVLVSLGIWPILVAIVTAVIAAVWARVIDLPGPVSFVLMLGAFAFTLAIIFWFRKLFTKGKAQFAPSKKPLAETGVPQQDLRIEHRFHGDSGHAELVLRNTSTQHALENVEVTFANFSIEGAPYTPIDVLSRLKARPRGTLQDTINAKDQKYYRFARVHPTQDERKYRISLWNVSEDAFSGKGCIVKFRISTKQSPAKLVYLRLSVDDTGHLTFSDYKRSKAKQSSTEYKPLNDAVMDAWERIRTLPEFDTQPSHSPEFASLRDYYEREPAKLPGIAAQIIFNSAVPPLPIEGVAPPRTAMEAIPHDKAAGYRFSDDAAEMFDIFDQDKPAEQRRRYTKLRVKRTDIERRVRAIEEENGKG